MPHRRHPVNTRPQFGHNCKMNTESCPNSIILNSDPRDKDLPKKKRTQKFESSPTSHDDLTPSVAMVNVSREHNNSQEPEYYLPTKATPKTSSGKAKSYRQMADGMLQQYTLMTYSSGPMMNSIYQNYNVTVPYPMHYSSYPLNMSQGAGPNICEERSSQSAYYQGQSFPSFFNPRTAQNMPHSEKVNNWIESIPVFFELSDERWKSECYDSSFPVDWEEEEFDDPLLAVNNKVSFATHDELLFLQAKKFETAIRKLYRLEKEPRIPQTDFLVDNNEPLSDYL